MSSYRFDLGYTLKILIIAAIAFLAITAYDELIDKTIIQLFNLDREAVSTWVFISTISTVLLIGIIYLFKIDAHDILGIAEPVHFQLTKTTKEIKDGQLIYTQYK
jgi:hypothetical protein